LTKPSSPNYDDIRQTEGFKNVSLGNVLSAKAPDEKIPFISDDDLAIYQKYRDPAFEVQVGLHELTGHGCGKLLQETSPGVFNFNKDSPPISPLTGKPITTWYKPGQTWGSVFGALAASYEVGLLMGPKDMEVHAYSTILTLVTRNAVPSW